MTDASIQDLFMRATGADPRKTLFFDLNDAPWVPVDIPVDGGGAFPREIVGQVYLHEYFNGMEVQVTDCGAYNILQTRIPPGFKVPRHRHNSAQLVFVMQGSAIQGNREIKVGGGWSTPPGNPYGIQAGPQGLTWLEVRTVPLSELETLWVETDPRRWVHRGTAPA
jgi:quercetin dioxygenase-like cupin family protein